MDNNITNNIKKEIYGFLEINETIINSWINTDYSCDIHISINTQKLLNKSDIIIFIGDYDCDGICATHIGETACKSLYPNKEVYTLLPTRQEGYGLNQRIVDFCKGKASEGKNVCVITVDTGIKEKEKLEDIKSGGCTVILTDHHILQKENDLPDVDMIIDPNVSFINNPLIGRNWCGAAVIYKLFENLVTPEIRNYLLNFAGIATIADIIELREGSWQLVRNAINNIKINAPSNLKMLITALDRDYEHICEDDIGYYIAPAFNAPGRLGYDSKMVLDFLNNPTKEKANELKEINDERKAIRDKELELVKNKIIEEHKENNNPIWIYMPNLHEGIIGILAGHIVEEFNTSACICTDDGNGNLKGSSRSYDDFNMYDYLDSNSNNLIKWGGHKGAAGFTLSVENFKEIQKNVTIKENKNKTNEKVLFVELMDIPQISRILANIRPFGEGFNEPIFETDIDLYKMGDNVKYIGKENNHLSITNKIPKYKLIHFHHKEEAEKLLNKNKFKAYGKVHNSYYKGFCTPELAVEKIEDIDNTEHNLDLD
jgi:single-stranded-DNA-specific exonuclease